MPYYAGKQSKVSTTIYITRGQKKGLEALKRATKVPEAERIRQGIDIILERFAGTIDIELRKGKERR